MITEHAFEQLATHENICNHWEATLKGCIFETLLGKPGKAQATHQQAYAAIRSRWPCDPAVCQMLLGPKIANVVAALLCSSTAKSNLCLFNDQYIVKPANCPHSGFAWHRDSDWCSEDMISNHSSYLSLWCALDDMTPDNGCLQVWSCPGGLHDHLKGSDKVAKSLAVQAGTAVIMSDRLMHCSLPNSSKAIRRAWMPQFSQQPIFSCGTNDPLTLAVPLISTAADSPHADK